MPALETEEESPDININKTTPAVVTAKRSFLLNLSFLEMKSKMRYINPTCRPETQRT